MATKHSIPTVVPRHYGRMLGVALVLAAIGAAQSFAGAAQPSGPSQNPATGPAAPLAAPGGQFLTDRYGRTVIMHGVNLVYKVPPFEVEVQGSGPNVLTVPEVQRMASLGFDVVRLGIIWKGLEPGTSQINDPKICQSGKPTASDLTEFNRTVFDAYLKRLDATIALLGKYGIYSFLDMHQDVYNQAFAGEGAPNWAVCTDGLTPHPHFNVPDWSENLNDAGVVQAYEHFWKNDVVGNLQGQFDAVWTRVAAHYRTNPWVIGYDPFNEPYGQGLPPSANGVAFDGELQCFYVGRALPVVNQAGQRVSCPPDDLSVGLIPQIEAADPTHLVFYEPNYTTDSSFPSNIGPMPFPRLVLNTHDYCVLHVPNGPEPPDFGKVCAPLEKATFTQRKRELSNDSTPEQRGGPALFLSEFGATTDAADLGRITADADSNLVGWTYWQWIHYNDPTGSHTSGLWPPTKSTPAQLQVLSRTYARAVAGTPTSMSFDVDTGAFNLAYRPNPRISQPTVIFVPTSTHYPHGFCTRASGGVISKPAANIVDVHNRANAATVTVSIVSGHC